jgi:ribosomal-protein-alanine N-acetyltransferase
VDIKLTTMTKADIDEVLGIERLSFPSPWSKQLFLNELANPDSHIILAKDDTGITLGFVCFWIVVDEVHILNIAVHPSFRRQGIARRLLTFVLEFSKKKGCSYFALEVRSGNQAAIELYKGFGFKTAGIRKGYYSDTGEDAILMELDLKAVSREP